MRALSLEYHDVVPGADYDVSGFPGPGPKSYKLSRTLFERHLEAIGRTKAAPTRTVDWQADGALRPVFLTFDDGGVGAYTCIAELLERRGWRGHFFVTVGRIGTPTFLSASQIRELGARGHVIGSHSYTHPTRMGACSPAQLDDEWRRSVTGLSDILGAQVQAASVPGGFYTRPVAEAAARAGVTVLFTSSPTSSCRIVDGCRVLGRYTLRHWSRPETAAAIAGGRWRPRASQWALYNTLTLLRTVGGDHYTALSRRFWARHAGGRLSGPESEARRRGN